MRVASVIVMSCFILGGASAQASISSEQKDELYLYMKAAVDRDCDGALNDETQASVF